MDSSGNYSALISSDWICLQVEARYHSLSDCLLGSSINLVSQLWVKLLLPTPMLFQATYTSAM
jgi:hypothetical protein